MIPPSLVKSIRAVQSLGNFAILSGTEKIAKLLPEKEINGGQSHQPGRLPAPQKRRHTYLRPTNANV